MLNTFSCSGGGLEPHKIDGSYRSVLKLAIQRVTSSDYGTYKCVSKNSLGDTEGTIKLYREYYYFVIIKNEFYNVDYCLTAKEISA